MGRHYIYLPVPTDGMVKIANQAIDGIRGALKANAEILRNPYVRGWKKGAQRWFSGGCLRGLGPNDTLYVILHGTGDMGSATVGEWYDKAPDPKPPRPLGAPKVPEPPRAPGLAKTYTPEGLAAVLQKEGLPETFRHLELLSCGGGLGDVHFLREAQERSEVREIDEHLKPTDLGKMNPARKARIEGLLAERRAEALADVREKHARMDTPEGSHLKKPFGKRLFDALVALGYLQIEVSAYLGDVKPGEYHADPKTGAIVPAATAGAVSTPWKIEHINVPKDALAFARDPRALTENTAYEEWGASSARITFSRR